MRVALPLRRSSAFPSLHPDHHAAAHIAFRSRSFALLVILDSYCTVSEVSSLPLFFTAPHTASEAAPPPPRRPEVVRTAIVLSL